MRYLFLLLIALPVWAATNEQLADEICRYHPDSVVCPVIEPPPEPNEPPVEPPIDPPPATGWSWVEIPSSAMDSVHNSAVDDQWPGAHRSWSAIQRAWSGGAVANGKLYVTGGGHADGAHNGVLGVDINGNWSRITEPGEIWRKADCPILPGDTKGTCTTDYGTCTLGWCTTGKDGQPVAIHSYNGLAADDNYLYRSGGSVWSHGNSGTGPKNFKLDLATGEWSTFPDCGRESTTSNLVHVDGKLYLITKEGKCVFDTTTWEWEIRKGAYAVPGKSTMAYHKGLDRFYIFGNKWLAWVDRAKFGTEWNKIENKPDLIAEKYLGVVEYGGIFMFWKSGVILNTFDPDTEDWGVITPTGDPGAGPANGPFGRFTVLNGEIVLVNGVSNNMYRLVPPEPPPEPIVVLPPAGPPTTPPTGELPQITVLDYPYYSEPQLDIIERTCGPLNEWEIRDITTDEQVEAQRGFRKGDRIIFNVYWKETIYPQLRIKGLSCGLVRGIAGQNGEKPSISVINMTHSAKDRPTRQGGLKIQDIRISMSEYKDHTGESLAGDCVGMPNSSQFVIFDNVDLIGCNHHAFITSRAYGMYLEIGNSSLARAGSHLAYIDSVAMAYIHDSTFESPGWGHALRCIAGTCLIQNNRVSNIQLDGTVLKRSNGKDKIGMHPLEVYNCGANHMVENTEINFYRQAGFGGSSMASNYRTRDAKWGCNLSYHTDTEWVRQDYGSDEWYANTNWPERDLTYRNVTINCLGDFPCNGISTWGSHPIAHDNFRGSAVRWLKANQFTTWDEMLTAMAARTDWPYPVEWYQWTAGQVFPLKQSAWLAGKLPTKWPVQPLAGELAVLTLDNVTGTNMHDSFVRPRSASTHFCWGVITDGVCSTGKVMPEAVEG